MKLPFDKKYLGLGLTIFSVIIASILFFMFLQNFSVFKNFIVKILEILTPIVYGFVIAYLLNPILKFFENKCYRPLFAKFTKLKRPEKLSRAFGVFTTIILMLAIVGTLFALVIPQLFQSISKMISNIPNYIESFEKFANDILKPYPELSQYANEQLSSLNETVSKLIPMATNSPAVYETAWKMLLGIFGVASSIINFFVGIIISVYVLYSKEIFASQFKRICYALFTKRFCERLFSAAKTTDDIFGKFISGKLLDATIVGILCFIFCAITKIPYAPLVAVLIGVTNIIPFFGPFIGAIPSAFIILMENPLKALIFIIFIIILQQLDGNFIDPKIVGETTGLSAFWVIFAILIFGGLFGVLGMFLGVPIFAVIYTFVKNFVDNRLEKKNLPVSADAYKEGGPDEA